MGWSSGQPVFLFDGKYVGTYDAAVGRDVVEKLLK